MYSLDQELAFAIEKLNRQRAEIAALKAELARARDELISMWAYYGTDLSSSDEEGIAKATARYTREIAQCSDEG